MLTWKIIRVLEVSIIYIYVYVGMKGPDENIGPWATPEDKLVQMKADKYWAEEEVRT